MPLKSSDYTAAVQTDVQRAQALGSNGVPFFVLIDKYGVSGAQPVELFSTALETAWADAHSLETLMGVDEDVDMCDDEICAV